MNEEALRSRVDGNHVFVEDFKLVPSDFLFFLSFLNNFTKLSNHKFESIKERKINVSHIRRRIIIKVEQRQ